MTFLSVSLAALILTDTVVVELGCDVIAPGADGTMQLIPMPELRILEGTAADHPYRPSLPAGTTAIACERTSLVPAARDDEVLLELRKPLYLSVGVRRGALRVGVLEISGGQFRFRMVEGALEPEEQAGVEQRLNEFQMRSERDRASGRPAVDQLPPAAGQTGAAASFMDLLPVLSRRS